MAQEASVGRCVLQVTLEFFIFLMNQLHKFFFSGKMSHLNTILNLKLRLFSVLKTENLHILTISEFCEI